MPSSETATEARSSCVPEGCAASVLDALSQADAIASVERANAEPRGVGGLLQFEIELLRTRSLNLLNVHR